jgi:hypothetical protein
MSRELCLQSRLGISVRTSFLPGIGQCPLECGPSRETRRSPDVWLALGDKASRFYDWLGQRNSGFCDSYVGRRNARTRGKEKLRETLFLVLSTSFSSKYSHARVLCFGGLSLEPQ